MSVDEAAQAASLSRGSWRAVRVFLSAQFAMTCGTTCGVIAVGKQVFDLTGREIDLGLLGLAEFAPVALLVFVTGAVADRFDRARVAATAAVGVSASALGLALLASRSGTELGQILTVVVLFGIARAFAAPSSRSLATDLVPPQQLSWLVPRVSATFQIGAIVGPVLGGMLYAVDPVAPFLAMAALTGTAAVAYTFVRALPTRVDPGVEPPARPGLREAFEGMRFIRRTPILLGAISLDLFAVLFGGAVILLPAIAEERLGVGAVGLGWLRASIGIGAGTATLLLARRPLQRHVGRVLLVVVALFGVGTVVLGLTRSYLVAFLTLAAISAADAVSVFIRSTLAPLVTPSAMRGRVLAVEHVFIGASNELGGFESGVAGQLLGVAGAVVLGGVATIVVAVVWWFAFPVLRDVDRFPSSPQGP
jgi:MFS family permease